MSANDPKRTFLGRGSQLFLTPLGTTITSNNQRKRYAAARAPSSSARRTPGTWRGAIPANVLLRARATASSLSVATSGFIFHLAGHSLAFVIFAAFAGVTTMLAWLLLAETKPASYVDYLLRRVELDYEGQDA